MKLDLVNRLLEVDMMISYRGKTKLVDKLVIDTGAAHTLISSDVVGQIGVYFENGDSLVSSCGIGGEEYSFKKSVDFIKLGNYEMEEIKLDFGNLGEWGINGLIGLDILMKGEFTIDLKNLELIQKK